ncbi:MAG: phosphate-starvation-inducible PsiE family protein [Methanoregula sp.]|nr:phosphate-starvation-inducible PsiE family protein [Methanoregula sp.]
MMIEYIDKFERVVYAILILLLAVVLVFALGELTLTLANGLLNMPQGLLENYELIAVLGSFLLVLITVELLDTMKAYITDNVIHVEVVVLLAIIAIARKVILLDPSSTDGTELIGIGIIIIGLAAAYYLLKKANFTIGSGKEKSPNEKPPQDH